MRAAAAAAMAQPPKYADDMLFEMPPVPVALPAWKNDPAWDPSGSVWWPED